MRKKPKRYVAAYMRVSTKHQSTQSQELDIDKWLSLHAEDDEFEYFRETCSGVTMDRPEWNKLEAFIRNGEISKLVVWRIDRLGRTAKGLTALFALLRQHKVGFVSIKDGIDLSTPAGRVVANILASIAEFENDVRSERVKAGMARAKAEGRILGGVKGRRCSMTKEQEETIVTLFKQGKNKSSIARATQISRPWIYEVLRRHELIPQKV
jgi:DNA invertase Pin-like site-specific DNA recombinase